MDDRLVVVPELDERLLTVEARAPLGEPDWAVSLGANDVHVP
jgi:hypothetical protein